MKNESVDRRRRIPFAAAVAAALAAPPVLAQDPLEEIVVTARKREESLQEVPVSISVINSDLLVESGIRDAYDLFEMTPGINWEQAQDRQGSRPSVRGVQTAAQNPVRQKVTSFLDGMPLLGQQGGLQFVGVDRVEVMRGPQSSAFGRATFAGAINYVSRTPGDEFSGDMRLATSSLGRNELQFEIGGPINETFGYTLDANFDEFRGADEWVSSDGYELGGQRTTYVTGKLTFAPNDNFDGYVRFIHSDIDDTPPIEWYPTRAERDACSNITLGMGNRYFEGAFNCEFAVPAGGYPRNHRPEVVFEDGTREYYAAQIYSVLDPSSRVERNRIQSQLNFNTEGGSTLELLAFYSEDDLRRWYDSDTSAANPVVSFPMGMYMVAGVSSMANPNAIEENYVEARWISPGEERLRWLVGASVYDYSSLTNVWSVYAGVVLELEDEVNNGNPFVPNLVLSDTSTNTGVYANVTYDITDQTTISFEGRFQRDDVTNIDNITGHSFNLTTDSFQPRIGLNHNLNEEVSVYAQISSGTNPAGVNLPFVEQLRIDSLSAAAAAGAVAFDETTFLTFEEESLTNFEVGVKANALENRLQLAAAVYVMEWDKMINPFTLSWDGDWNDGSFDPNGNTFTGPFVMARTFINTGVGDLSGVEVEAAWAATDNWTVRGAATLSSLEYSQFCDPLAVQNLGLTATHTAATGAATACVEVGGNRLLEQPEQTLVLSPTFRSDPIGTSDWTWMARLDMRYEGDWFVDATNIMSLPATATFNGSLAFRNGDLTIRLYGSNLTDDATPRRVDFANDNGIAPTGPGRRSFRIRPRLPREVGAQLTYQF